MSYEELMMEYQKSQQENTTLKSENTALKAKVENQQLQINVLNRYLFGSKRESTNTKKENIVEGTQCSIFGVPEDENVKQQIEEKTEEITVYRKKKNTKNPAGIKKAELKNVETITEECVLNTNNDKCPIGSSISSSLATEVIYQKYYMGIPLYRQEKVWDDRGLVFPRNMMAKWCIKLSEYYLEPIYNLMLKQMKQKNELLHR